MLRRVLLVLFLMLASCLVGYRQGVRYVKRLPTQQVVARANGLPVTREFLNQLDTLFERDVLELALEYRLVEDAASRLRIEVSERELNKVCGATPRGVDEAAYRAVQRFLLLSKKLVLHRYGEDEKRELWAALRSDLCLYKLRLIVFRNQSDLESFWQDRPTSGNFRELARRYNAASELALREGGLNARSFVALRALLGPEAAVALEQCQPGQLTPSLASNVGVMVAMLEERRDSYEDLLPSLEQLIFEGGRARLSYDLRNDGEITTDRRVSPLAPSGSSFLNPLIGTMESYNSTQLDYLPKPRSEPSWFKKAARKLKELQYTGRARSPAATQAGFPGR